MSFDNINWGLSNNPYFTDTSKLSFDSFSPSLNSSTFGELRPLIDPTKMNDQSLGMLDWTKLGLQGLASLGGLYLGMKQYGLQKQALNNARDQWNKNYEAQRKTINSQLEDRQRARVASNPTAYQSVGDYMNKYRI